MINLSLGGSARSRSIPSSTSSRAPSATRSPTPSSRGAVVVAAVGNSPSGTGAYASWPAALPPRDRRLGGRPDARLGAVLEHRLRLQRHRRAGRRHHHDRAARARAAPGSSLDAPPGVDDRRRRHRARHVVRRAARERGRGGAARAPPRAHADAGDVDPRAHRAPPRRRRGRRARPLHGLRPARRHGRGQARRRAARSAAAGRRRRAQRRRRRRAGARDARRASPTRSPTSATTAATSTRSTCAPARRSACARRRCRCGGNLGLDVGIFSPRRDEPRELATRRARRARGRPRRSARCTSATRRGKDGFFSCRRRRGAAGAPTACAGALDGPAAERGRSGAEQLVGRARRAARARAGRRRRVRAGTSRSTIAPAPTNASSPISTPGSRIAAPPTRRPAADHRALHERLAALRCGP